MQRIIFFDGVCNLCDSVVSRVFNIDKNHRFLFASLQSETAKKLLTGQDFEYDSIIYFQGGSRFYNSDAVLEILKQLGGIYFAVSFIAGLFPKLFRDWIYRKVAKNRYQIFGKKDTCRLPNESEKAYFLE